MTTDTPQAYFFNCEPSFSALRYQNNNSIADIIEAK